MIELDKSIFIGDVHLGIKRFNIPVLKNQLLFFTEQIFPYMKKNNIKTIFQLGDLFDNRSMCDIMWLEKVKELFFDKLVENDIILYTLYGNHDIVLRESREYSLITTFEKLYPNNFYAFRDREEIQICNRKTLVVPWIVSGEDLTYNEIKDMDYVLGHFELRHFAMVKGHMDTTSKLTTDFFIKNTNIKGVYSGHYHIKDTDGLVKYLGSTSQLNWSDYNESKGFYVFDGINDLEFHSNTSTKKFIKAKYNDIDNEDKVWEVTGLYDKTIFLSKEEYAEIHEKLLGHEVKVFINKAKDRAFDEDLYIMKENKISAVVIDNQQISEIIGTSYISEDDDAKDTRTIVMEAVKEHNEDLLPILLELFSEIDSNLLDDK